jgi:mannose-6-phosphate isomerase-like protein (cupin superfamily)
MDAVVVSVEDAENLDRGAGRGLRLLLDAAATGGHLSALLCTLEPAQPGPPLHIHPGTDELFVVLEGALLIHAAGRTSRVERGGAAFVPRGTSHTFASPTDAAVRFLGVHTPGGFEQMHRDVLAAEQATGRALAPADIIPIAGRHDWELAGPPLLPSGVLASVGPAMA